MEPKLATLETYLAQTTVSHQTLLRSLARRRQERKARWTDMENQLQQEKKKTNDSIESERLTRVMAGQMVKAREDAILQLKKYIRDNLPNTDTLPNE